jgi:hypothetical protein
MKSALALLAMLFAVGVIPGCCVAEGTLIATPSGEKKVESLVVGDEVLTVSPEGKIETGKVARIQRHLALNCRTLELSGGAKLRLTDMHPVSTLTGWTKAGQLSIGQKVRTLSGWQPVTAIRSETGLVTVYDITVEPNANFIAGGVVVHNKSPAPTVRPEELPGNWAGFAVGNGFQFYYRLEIYQDGTGLFGTKYGVCNVGLYRITKWSIGEYRWHNPYTFHADLVDVATGTKAELSGKVGWSALTLGYRQPDWGKDCYQSFVVVPEGFMDANIAQTKDAMRSYAARRVPMTQPRGQ